MTGDFAAELGADFLHFSFYKTVADAGHDRNSAEFFDFVDDDLGSFDIKNDFWFFDLFYQITDEKQEHKIRGI